MAPFYESIIGICEECCAPLPEPAIQWDSRSRSQAKGGFPELTATSSPPRYYLTATYSGGNTAEFWNPSCANKVTQYGGWSQVLSGTQTYDAYGTLTNAATITRSGFGIDPSRIGTFSIGPTPSIGDLDDDFANNVGARLWWACVSSEALTQTTSSVDYTNPCCSVNIVQAGTASCALSDEYTTALLVSSTIAALPAFPGTWAGTAGSARSLASTELSLSIREARWRAAIPTSFVSGATYRLYYSPRFTPDLGGPFIDAEAYIEFTWNGTDTHLAGSTIAIPTSNGVSDITNTRWEAV